MKILRIIYDWPPPWQGLAAHPYELTASQLKEGHEVEIKMPLDIKGSYYQVNVNQSAVLLEVGGWNAYSYSFQKKITNYNSNQSKVTLFPNRTYIIRNVKEGYSNKVVIFLIS